MRDCRSCTLCCLFMKVPEYNSLEYEYCSNCTPNVGCSVYESRQEVCRKFGCLWWLQEQIPEHLRPDKCGVMFEITASPNLVFGYVHPDRPLVWKLSSIQTLIRKLNEANYSVVLCLGKGKGNLGFPVDGMTCEELRERTLEYGRSFIHN